MANRRGSFGMVVLVVTMAIVMFLVAKQWKQLASSAKQAGVLTGSPSATSSVGAQHGIETSSLPNLRQAEAATAVHATGVGEALEATQDWTGVP